MDNLKRLISRAKFAEEAGVSRAAVTKACSKGLAPAICDDMIDSDHPSAVAYLQRKRKAKTSKTPKIRKKKKAPNSKASSSDGGVKSEPATSRRAQTKTDSEEETPVADFLDMTLREIIDRFGSKSQFKDYLAARRHISYIEDKELTKGEKQKTLISRALVSGVIFPAIENMNQRLLNDAPRTINQRVSALIMAEAPTEEREQLIMQIISTQLRGVKEVAQKTLEADDA